MNIPFVKRPTPQRPLRQGKCELKIKRNPRDGSITKSISPSCTPAQVEALKSLGKIDESTTIDDDF